MADAVSRSAGSHFSRPYRSFGAKVAVLPNHLTLISKKKIFNCLRLAWTPLGLEGSYVRSGGLGSSWKDRDLNMTTKRPPSFIMQSLN